MNRIETANKREGTRIAILSATLLIACAISSEAADTHHVSGPEQFADAMQGARPGDTVLLRDGEWKDADLLFEGEGTPEHPITLRAETPGAIVFTGSSRLRVKGSHVVVDGLHFRDGWLDSGDVIRLEGSHLRLRRTLIDRYNNPDREVRYFWVSLRGTHHVVEDCAFFGMNHSGVTVVVWRREESPNYHRIRRNHFADRPQGTANGWETIRIGTSGTSLSDSHTIVEENLFERCNGEHEIISSKSGKNIFRNNTFVECEGALTLRHGNDCLVEGNFFLGNNKPDTGGVRVIGEDHRVINNYFQELAGDRTRSACTMMQGIADSPLHGYYQVKRATVAFNTFVHCRNSMVIGLAGRRTSLPPEDSVIANNLLVSDGPPLIQHGIEPRRLTYEGNLFWGGPRGISRSEGIRRSDPKLEGSSEDLWRPAENSPAIGSAAAGFAFVTMDIEGRPRGENKDIGAHQFSPDRPERRPLTGDDVGPDWLRKPDR